MTTALVGAVLALDIATRTGWCLGEPGGPPKYGSIRFEGSSHEMRWAAAAHWAAGFYRKHRPGALAYETPGIYHSRKTNIDTKVFLGGLVGITAGTIHACGMPADMIFRADTPDVRRHFIQANPKRAIAKDLTKAKCRELGYEIQDDDEADAIAVWHFACAYFEPRLAMEAVPLLRGLE
jgi:hypothetical protein